MGTEAEFKKRQKELMGEWKANALKYSKNLRTIEESWKKLGPFPCEVLLDNQFAHAELTEQFITLGNHRVAGGELSEENAIKLRNELVALNARWNKSVRRNAKPCGQDVDKEYKKHALWFTKCDNMDQWLAESEKLIRQQSKVSDEPKELKEQMDDIQ
ncbi:predicted protein, partial [Nematostella vectensis]